VLFLLLFVPALVALLIAGAGLWAAWGQARRSAAESVGMGVVALVFGGFAAFLLALWLRERRGSGRADEQGEADEAR
jgi:ABC-type sulfate transport system permease component